MGLIHGCTVARGAPTISHLLFADDCYLLFRATGQEAAVMKNILVRYEFISGQSINYNKPIVIFYLNTTLENRDMVCTQLGVREDQVPGKYLGMPMRIGADKVSTFGFLQDKVQQRLQGYGDKVLSKVGKVTVLKTAVQAIPNFWMSLFLIPMEIYDGIEKQMNVYWWCNKTTGRGIRWF
ncbi:uncharacterized protein LOC141719934 [Apium graveolens]|uniref:uncharacterized protein LOC141719934 n=1 Tax=Apium graveolens TaxID=4045 RepID=UPI003D7BA38D